MLEKIDLKEIEVIAKKAGDAVMEIYKKDFQVEYKDDKSPLTQADLKANEIICKGLTDLNSKFKIQNSKFIDTPIMSEENRQEEYEIRKNWEYYWCIDPIDGTKEFIKKNGEFTINIALVHKNTPVLGVVYAPVLDDMYSAKKAQGAFKNGQRLPLITNNNPQKHLTVVASKSHLSDETKAFIGNLALKTENLTFISKGSSLKLLMVADGSADIYPRLAPTMEWDTAAADAIVRESGKMTYQYHSKFDIQHLESEYFLLYNKKNLLNPWFIVK